MIYVTAARLWTIEHVIISCSKYDSERQRMKEELRRSGIWNFSLRILVNLPREFSDGIFFKFMRQTEFMSRIQSLIHTPEQQDSANEL